MAYDGLDENADVIRPYDQGKYPLPERKTEKTYAKKPSGKPREGGEAMILNR
jgi:hypothetical protein